MTFLLQATPFSFTDICTGLPGFLQMPYIYLMLLAFVLATTTYYLLRVHRDKLALAALFLAALFARLFMVFQDAFLHPWDERYHALVARNMLNAPFTPMLLRFPLGAYNYKLWNYCHIWLHKQPLFSWQMALSVKLFGVSEYSIRFPSAVLGALMTVMIYDITLRLVNEKYTAFFAALFFCFSRFHLEQVSGLWGLDHNDVAFHFYVLASIWAYTRYSSKPHWVWPLLIGFFAGCAVLNKWLVGLVVFGGWGINLLLSLKNRTSRREWSHFLLSLAVSTVIFLPWQLYITHRFPVEAAWEYTFNGRHITEALEGHSGNFLYYFGRLPGYWGIPGCLLVFAGWAILSKRLFQKRLANPLATIGMLTIFPCVFIFFSIVVKTKMPGYVYMLTPLAAIFISMALAEIKKISLQNKLLKNKSLYLLWSTVTLIFVFSPAHIYLRHKPDDPKRITAVKHTQQAKNIRSLIPVDNKFIFNATEYQAIDIMFYHNDLSVHWGAINRKTLDSLQVAGHSISFFPSRTGHDLPSYVRENPTFHIIPISN